MAKYALSRNDLHRTVQDISRETGTSPAILTAAVEADAIRDERAEPDEIAFGCPEMEAIERRSFEAAVGRALSLIGNDEDRRILRRYYGMGDGAPLRIGEISRGMKLSATRIRNSLRRSMTTLGRSRGLRNLYTTECR
jgi:DNA-directed RNA polymerase sigma subunit (sigma70/sigma32)